MSVKSLPLNPTVRLVVLPAVAIVCALMVFFALRWCLANAISARVGDAERVPPRELAQLAADLGPNDPQSHYAMAVLDEKSFRLEDVPRSLGEYERATALSPGDYRLWFALGRARDRAGETEGAELALREAVRLAPHYAQVRWAFGNVLLRRGQVEEGFAAIREAAAADAKLAGPAISTVWQFSEGDVSRVVRAVGDSMQIKSALAVFLANQKMYDEAFAVWNELPETAKKETYRAETAELLKQLLNGKKFRAALAVQTQTAAETSRAAVGKITNAGFEEAVNTSGAEVFEWRIAQGLQPVVATDDKQKRGGARSLVIAFNSGDGKDFRTIEQTVALAADDSNRKYKFEVFARSDLKTSATVRWEIADVADGKVLAATEAVPSGSVEWTPQRAEFTVPPGAEAVTIRLARAPCGSLICPISGKVWFDDFSLQ